MEGAPGSRRQRRLRHAGLMAVLAAAVACIAWLTERHSLRFDWSAGARNTLSEASRVLLEKVPGPLAITAFVREDPVVRRHVSDLVNRYRAAKPDLSVRFVDPLRDPERMRALGAPPDGAIVVEYRGRSEVVRRLGEQALSNAIVRVARGSPRRLVALVGHGERRLLGRANHDLGNWGRHLERRGFVLHEIELAKTAGIPHNASALVIAGPRVDLLPGEALVVEQFVAGGGNLLWLTEPGSTRGLDRLAAEIGVVPEDGTVIDPAARRLGIPDPTVVVVGRYPAHAATRGLEVESLFPGAVGLRPETGSAWRVVPLLVTGPDAWSKTGDVGRPARFDPERDAAGPLAIGLALERERGVATAAGAARRPRQRVAVVGDGDFLSNAYLGNLGNLDLGLRIVNWLSRDDALIEVPARTTRDATLVLSGLETAVIGFGLLLGLPAALFATGAAIWRRRRRR